MIESLTSEGPLMVTVNWFDDELVLDSSAILVKADLMKCNEGIELEKSTEASSLS